MAKEVNKNPAIFFLGNFRFAFGKHRRIRFRTADGVDRQWESEIRSDFMGFLRACSHVHGAGQERRSLWDRGDMSPPIFMKGGRPW